MNTLDEQAENTIASAHRLLAKLALQEILGVRGFPRGGNPFQGPSLSHLQPEVAIWTFPQGFEELSLLAYALSRCGTLLAPGMCFETLTSHRGPRDCLNPKSDF